MADSEPGVEDEVETEAEAELGQEAVVEQQEQVSGEVVTVGDHEDIVGIEEAEDTSNQRSDLTDSANEQVVEEEIEEVSTRHPDLNNHGQEEDVSASVVEMGEASNQSHDVAEAPASSSSVIDLPQSSTSASVTAVVKVGAKRKALDSNEELEKSVIQPPREDEDDDEGAVCNICMEPWTNSGEHRIASLRCGHFFGLSCVEKWLRGGGSGVGCPNCNEKATRRDLRVHYIARLKAIDTAERDRALREMDRVKKEYKQLELEHTTLKVTLNLQAKEIEKLKQEASQLRMQHPGTSAASAPVAPSGNTRHQLRYLKRIELVKVCEGSRFCRIMTYNDFYGMLIISQPSFTALAPGFGVRKVSLLEQKAGAFISLHKEPIRDLALNPTRPEQLLSVSQEKSIKLTNVNTCQVVQKYACDHEPWSCCWSLDSPTKFFVGTKRSEVLLFDTRDSTHQCLPFPVVERRPIIALCSVPKTQECAGGVLVQTLGSLWFFEDCQSAFQAHKLPLEGPFWSMRYDPSARLCLITTKPTPHSRHVVCELVRVDVQEANNSYTLNIVLDQRRGGSYSDRSFLRSALEGHPGGEGRVLAMFSRGSGLSDQKVVVQEIGAEKVLQEFVVPRPILDMVPIRFNDKRIMAFLSETDVLLYQWTRIDNCGSNLT